MNTLEKMFVGGMIAVEGRPLGFSHAQKTDIGPADMKDEAARIIYTAIQLASSTKWQSVPTPDVLATIILAEGLTKPADDTEATLSALRQQIIAKVVDFANSGVDDVGTFQVVEAQISIKKGDDLFMEFATQTAPQIAKNPIGTIIDKSEAMLDGLQKIANSWQPDSRIYNFDDQYAEVMKEIEYKRKMIENHERVMTFPPEFGRLSTTLVPDLRKSLMYVIKGPTKSGKSSAMEQIADWLCRGFHVVYMGWEDSMYRKMVRQTCRMFENVTFDQINRGDYDNYTQKAFTKRKEWMKEGKGSYTYVYCAGRSAQWAIQQINKLQATQGVDVVICDYIQKMDVSGFKGDQWEGYAMSAELLKQRAEQPGKELVMIVGSQISVGENGKTWTRGGKDLEMKGQCVISIQVKDAEQDEIVNGFVLARKGDPSYRRILRVEYTNDGRTGSEDLIFWGPRFMYTKQEYLRASPSNSFYVPVMTAPTQEEKEEAWKINEAYKSIGSAGREIPF